MSNKPLYLEASIKVDKETDFLKERASSIIDLPKEGEKQIDLMYFSAIFVSSGENLNGAFFEPHELTLGEKTIVNKALDIEHNEKEIIGHLYDRVFIDEYGNILAIDDLKTMSKDDLNVKNIHVAIAGIIYKNRFPEVAKEVAEGKWKVSMECYYSDFDLKIGNLLLTRKDAEALGFGQDCSSIIGKIGKVIKDGKEMASGKIARVLRGITFSGCGIVENPANPPSIVLEVAKKNKEAVVGDEVVFDFDKISNDKNKLTLSSIEDSKSTNNKDSALVYDDTVGICVHYKRRNENKEGTVVNEDWCSKFESGCTSFSRDATDVDCLLNKVSKSVARAIKKELNKKRVESLLENLYGALEKISR